MKHVLFLLFSLSVSAFAQADYHEDVAFGILHVGQPLTAAVHPPGQILAGLTRAGIDNCRCGKP